MTLDLQTIMKTVGPAASMVFAAWIFMGFLQQRYDSAVARYQSMIERYRRGDDSPERHANVKDQVLVYKRRCELMSRASIVGLVSANLLILTLIVGGLDVILPDHPAIRLLGIASGLAGFTLVIVACLFVIAEALITHRQLDSELLDVPDLASSLGKTAGSIRDPHRRAAAPRA